MLRPIACATLILALAGCTGTPRTRPQRSPEQLLAARAVSDQEADATIDGIINASVLRAKAEYDEYLAGRRASAPTVEMLIISGGGDLGAFGAGFLKGWGKVTDPAMARPKFDIVTGVSTGAMIAPFAFLGDDESIEKIVRLYRNPQKNWVRSHGFLGLFGKGESLADITGLEAQLKRDADSATIKRIAEDGATGRVLAVSATDIDTGEMHVWNVVEEARRAVETGNSDRVQQILLASSAIPAVFPPREIDGVLYVDGAVTGNILFGGPRARKDDETFIARWKEKYPDAKPPAIRYWVIYNNQLRRPPTIVQPRWSSIAMESIGSSNRAATINSIRQLFLQAQIAKLKHGASIEVRVASIPDDWVPPITGTFQKETMNNLADIGEKMGADPASWRTEPP